jgi:hypothetical protein
LISLSWTTKKIGHSISSNSIVTLGNQRCVLDHRDIEGEYLTREAAFGAATAAVSVAVRLSHEVHVSVASREDGEFARVSAEQQTDSD